MLPTPDTSHVSYDQIYEPAEDSYLLLDTLSSASQTSFLKHHFSTGSTPLALEIGTGSGVVLAFISSNAPTILGRGILSLGCDLNRLACVATSTTVTKALDGVHSARFLGALNTDLTSAIRDREIDILVFNPPYVPAELPDLEKHAVYNDGGNLGGQEAWDRDSHLLALSYAGGKDGMEVTDRLLGDLSRVLSERGVAYVLLCKQNRPEEVMERVRGWKGGWAAEIVGSSGKKAGWEKLVVVRIMRKSGG